MKHGWCELAGEEATGFFPSSDLLGHQELHSVQMKGLNASGGSFCWTTGLTL
jgi:hypothetical protein